MKFVQNLDVGIFNSGVAVLLVGVELFNFLNFRSLSCGNILPEFVEVFLFVVAFLDLHCCQKT